MPTMPHMQEPLSYTGESGRDRRIGGTSAVIDQGASSEPATHWLPKPRMRFFDQSATSRKCGTNADSRHQRSSCTGARLSKPTSTTISNPPRAAPNTMPRKRSVPENPVTRTNAPTSNVATNKMAHAAMTCADGVLMNSARWCESAPPNIHATTPAMIQVSSDSASLTKPRFKLIRLEMTMTATMAQSTQVKVTGVPAKEKGGEV